MVLATLVLTAFVMDKLSFDQTWKDIPSGSTKAFESVLYVGLVFLLFSWANTLYGLSMTMGGISTTDAKYKKWKMASLVFEVLNLLLLGVLVYQYSRIPNSATPDGVPVRAAPNGVPNFQPTNTYWAYVGCTALAAVVVVWICRLEWKRVTRSKTVMQNLQRAFDAAVVVVEASG